MTTCTAQTGDRTATFEVPADTTILDAALAAGWEIPYSCRKGTCETCRAGIVSGEVTPAPDADGTALLCRTRALSDVTIAPLRLESAQPDARRTVSARVYRVRWPADDVAMIDLRFPAGIRVPFQAGQYLQVLLPDEAPRSFSMANPPKSSDGVQLHVRVIPGGLFGEKLKSEAIQAGDTFDIELPFGDFHLRDAPERPAVLVAGGTGFAPIQSILEHALAKQKDREFVLYWGGRDQAGLYALDQVAKWQRRYPHFRFVGVVSDEAPAEGQRAGLVHEAVLADYPDMSGVDVYACGAPGLIQAARRDFTARGLPADRFFADSFVTPADA